MTYGNRLKSIRYESYVVVAPVGAPPPTSNRGTSRISYGV